MGVNDKAGVGDISGTGVPVFTAVSVGPGVGVPVSEAVSVGSGVGVPVSVAVSGCFSEGVNVPAPADPFPLSFCPSPVFPPRIPDSPSFPFPVSAESEAALLFFILSSRRTFGIMITRNTNNEKIIPVPTPLM